MDLRRLIMFLSMLHVTHFVMLMRTNELYQNCPHDIGLCIRRRAICRLPPLTNLPSFLMLTTSSYSISGHKMEIIIVPYVSQKHSFLTECSYLISTTCWKFSDH